MILEEFYQWFSFYTRILVTTTRNMDQVQRADSYKAWKVCLCWTTDNKLSINTRGFQLKNDIGDRCHSSFGTERADPE